jgi:signal transduction histidine kinase
LNNIFRHANAQNIDLIVYYWKNRFKIRIKDDGIGFDAREATGSKDISRGWGILGMKERVELLNGSIVINSTINHGTEIGIEIPLNTGVNCG